MSASLRILYHHRIRADDGQAVHVRELIGALRAAGHQVHECALVRKSVPTAALPGGGSGRGGFWQRLRLPRTAVECLEVAYNRRGRTMLRAAAAAFAPDLIYERHALHCRAGLDVARELGVPLLLEVNSPMVEEMRNLGLLRLPKRAAATERTVLSGADAVLAVTQVLADMLVARGARRDRVHVIQNGAVLERYDAAARAAAVELRRRQHWPAPAFVLGFVGYVRPWHRLDLVFEVMQRPGFEPLCLWLCGRGPALADLQAQAAARGLTDRVRFAGEVPPDLLPTFVCAFDAALVPAINAYSSPLKLFDSLAAGVPTLAPDQPNLREVVTDGAEAVLFQPGSADALAAAIRRMLTDPELVRRVGAAGRQSLIDHQRTWAGNAARVAAIGSRLLRTGDR
ncbi:MAG: glycosyltransferase family 4 protein [Planctomycetes bacterium]|nr:glycosyltransferase family 4 protein [Planctomycetota bacterium]